jgi:hypothetical protein
MRARERSFVLAVALIARPADSGEGAIRTQVLIEFYNAATGKLRMRSEEAVGDLAGWIIHHPTHADILKPFGFSVVI